MHANSTEVAVSIFTPTFIENALSHAATTPAFPRRLQHTGRELFYFDFYVLSNCMHSVAHIFETCKMRFL